MSFPIKILFALISILLAFLPWIGFGMILDRIKILDLIPWPYSSYIYLGSYGLFVILSYSILAKFTGNPILSPKEKGSRIWILFIRTGIAILSVSGAFVVWRGMVFFIDKISWDAGFSLSPFHVAGWLLFGILSIVIYSFMVKLQQRR